MFLVVLSLTAFAASVTIRPIGQGTYKDWASPICTKILHWQCVDEQPANTSDYLYTGQNNKSDTFLFQNSGLTTETVDSVTLSYYAKMFTSSKYKVRPVIRNNAGISFGQVKNLAGTWILYADTYLTNPLTGQPWTSSQVNALEAGIGSFSSYGGGLVAQVYAIVNYTPLSSQDSCSDSDGGNSLGIFGTTSGELGGSPYTYSDFCTNSQSVNEYYCAGSYSVSQEQSCGTDSIAGTFCMGNEVHSNGTDYFCAIGACGQSQTTQFQENCDGSDGYGSNYCINASVYSDYKDYSCSSGSCSFVAIPSWVKDCPDGCSDGGCLSGQTCNDTDGGRVYDIAGSVYINGTIRGSDVCTNLTGGINLIEKYCDASNNYKIEYYICPNGCSAAACV
ncbi:hypothetical protein HYU13_02425 [Candidatus Woesearchaeota archaeon]|nr:hypothetical protein [Candidatus Woesearchaeota archaeon]